MCGIFGTTWPAHLPLLVNRVDDVIKVLSCRGPDDNGLEHSECGASKVVLGHTRLSIIDLSLAGHQPMTSADGRYSIVFNGEIYNYKELREELKPLGYFFTSGSDTEVLLTAWQHWGSDCLSQLVGMFAFVVLDRAGKTLTCVRDAFGIKPFYFAEEGKKFLFASEISAIKILKQEAVELNWQRSYDYLVHGDYDSNSSTFLSGVFQLQPGHLIQVDLSSNSVSDQKNWWYPTIKECNNISFDQASERVRDQFLKNIRLHLRSDVPVGAALSGGIDSSAVVCAMRVVERNLPIHTFSYIAQGSLLSEEKWVNRVNEYVGATSHKVIATGQELATDIDDLIRLQGEPFGSTSIYAQYRVFKLAREKGIKVTLDGQGADEMLAGYNGYPGQRIRSLIEKGFFAEALYFLNEWSRWPGRNKVEGVKRAIAEVTHGQVYDILRQLNGPSNIPSWINIGPLENRGILKRNPRQRPELNEPGRRISAELALSLTKRGLPSLLRHGDRNSMRFSIESRVPFLSLDMVNLLLSLPESFLISPTGQTKSVFRAAMRGIVPDDILDRKDKIGFSTPEQDWLFAISDRVRGWLKEDLDLPFYNQEQVVKTFDQIISGKRVFSYQVWRWINFSRWYATTFS